MDLFPVFIIGTPRAAFSGTLPGILIRVLPRILAWVLPGILAWVLPGISHPFPLPGKNNVVLCKLGFRSYLVLRFISGRPRRQ
ncbi:MAG: hypothetical protein P1P86_10590 [Bacteroidales bacterium]|nr:hypothetical protein [Bacteroidales bacterium]